MYKITKIRHVDRRHGTELANSGKAERVSSEEFDRALDALGLGE